MKPLGFVIVTVAGFIGWAVLVVIVWRWAW